MKAAYINEFGSAQAIISGELPDPQRQVNEVLIKVLAASVNHVDTFIRSGGFQTETHFPFVIGRDAVGEVLEAPMDSPFSVGDLVWTNSMGYASRPGVTSEFAAIPTERLFPVPSNVDPLQLIAAVHPAATAVILLDLLQATAGETLLIEGAAGHVGAKLVQVAKELGLNVITASSPKDFDKLKALGADQSFDYHTPYLDQLGEPLDYIIDTSGKVSLQDNLNRLAHHGKIGLITAPPDNTFTFNVREFYTASQQIIGFVISRATLPQLRAAGQKLNEAFTKGLLLEDDLMELPLSEAAHAQRSLENGENHRKRILLIP